MAGLGGTTIHGDALALPSSHADGATVAFGIRNGRSRARSSRWRGLFAWWARCRPRVHHPALAPLRRSLPRLPPQVLPRLEALCPGTETLEYLPCRPRMARSGCLPGRVGGPGLRGLHPLERSPAGCTSTPGASRGLPRAGAEPQEVIGVTRFFVGITGPAATPMRTRSSGRCLRPATRSTWRPRQRLLVLRHELGVEAGVQGRSLRTASRAGSARRQLARALPLGRGGPRPPRARRSPEPPSSAPAAWGLGRVRAGFNSNLVERVADVALKEGGASCWYRARRRCRRSTWRTCST